MDALQRYVHDLANNNAQDRDMPVAFVIQNGRRLTNNDFSFGDKEVRAGEGFAVAMKLLFYEAQGFDYSPIMTSIEGNLAIRTVFCMAGYQKFDALNALLTSPRLLDACNVSLKFLKISKMLLYRKIFTNQPYKILYHFGEIKIKSCKHYITFVKLNTLY